MIAMRKIDAFQQPKLPNITIPKNNLHVFVDFFVTVKLFVCIGVFLVAKYGWRKVLGMKHLLIFSISANCLNVFFIYATKYTLSVYVQLIMLSVPFLVAVIAQITLKAPLPPYTTIGMLFSFKIFR